MWPDERRKIAHRCGAKHISKSKCTKHTMLGPLLKVVMSKKCTPLWREAHFQVKMYKTHHARSTLEIEMSKKCTSLCREAHSQVKSVKNWRVRSTFGRSDVVLHGRRKGLCTLSKVSKTWGFLACSKKTMAGVGRLERIWEDAFSVAGRWFPERGCILEHQIFSFGKVIWCSTLCDLASLFRGRRHTSEIWAGKIAKCCGTRLSALHTTFHYWRTSRRIASWCCQLQKLRKSRRIASFLMLPTPKIEEVLQNCFF